MRHTLVCLTATFLVCAVPSFTTDTGDFAVRIDELLQKMTLEEKVGQLNQYSSTFDITGPAPTDDGGKKRLDRIKNGMVGSMLNVTGAEATRRAQQLAVENSRLGIPLIFAYDVIHGYKTMFPVPLGESASWNMEAISLSARVAATEAAAAGLHWTFAPMIDISRDARWGRVMEGAGEDPYLGSRIAVARIHGFQGDDLSALDTVAACAKHFAAYGFAEAGRDYNTTDISDDTLHNIVLPPFKASVDAGVATLMNGFNELGGVAVTGSVYLQREILKGDWGFKGLVVSDWGSIGEMIAHGNAADKRDAARMAITAGSDMDMEAEAYIDNLVDLVKSGVIKEDLIDDAVRRVLALKFAMGLFEDPYRYSDAKREKDLILSKKHMDAARDVARKSIVLLKNDNNILPLAKDKGSIAVIGGLAADKDTPLGSWRGKAVTNSAVSMLEGIQAGGKGAAITYAKGADLGKGVRNFIFELAINEDDRSGFPAAVEAARKADTVVIAMGEEAFQSGEGRSQVNIGFRGVQMDLFNAVYEVNKNIVVVLMNGRPLVLGEVADKATAIVEAWHLGSQAGHAIADVLYGDYNPSGKLPVSFPRHAGQVPIYYNHKNTGRPDPKEGNNIVFWSHYVDAPNSPLYPFGFGLSYTTFAYGEVRLSTTEMGMKDTLTVSVDVTNTGKVTGTETVQMYIRDLVGSTTRPVKELKGFEQITLKPGASKTVSFTLDAQALSYYNSINRKWLTEPGDFHVFVGTDSHNVKKTQFTLKQ